MPGDHALATPEALLPADLRRKLERLSLAAGAPLRGRLLGEQRSPRRGRGVELADFRPYVPGDDPRLLDWNAYARLDRHYLRRFQTEEDRCLHLCLDTSASMAWGEPAKVLAGARLAAALGYVSLLRGDRLVLSLLGEGTDPAGSRILRGRADTTRLLATLSAVEPAGETSLETALTCHAARWGQRGPLILISDLLDPNWEAGLRTAQAGRYQLSLIQVLAPEELRPELSGELRLIDSETGEALEASLDAETLGRYRARLDRWRSDIRQFCLRRGASQAEIASDVPLDAELLAQLRRRGILAL